MRQQHTADLPTMTPREVELHKRIVALQCKQIKLEDELRRVRRLLSDAYADKLNYLSRSAR